MELATTPDLYAPSIDDTGNYIDVAPPTHTIRNGLMCPCGKRKDNKVFTTAASFKIHFQSITHQKWLQSVNFNKNNYISQNTMLTETVEQQKLLIANLQRELHNKTLKIQELEREREREKEREREREQQLNNVTNPFDAFD